MKYNGVKNQVLLSYEDEDKKWHKLDHQPGDLTSIRPGFEGSLDSKSIKFRVVALAKDGEGAILRFGDDSDYQVEEGQSFPPIPPALSESRLPKLIYNTQVIVHGRAPI